MEDDQKSRQKLLAELKALRARLETLEAATGQRSAEEALYEASHDELTGLYNREHFIRTLGIQFLGARRYAYPLSLCLCELRGLEESGELRDSPAGEEILAEFGEIIRNELRGHDIGARYGESAFAVIFPHTTARSAAVAADRIRRHLEELVAGAGAEGPTVSGAFGVAELASEQQNEQALIAAAQKAYERAVAAGGNCVVAD